MLALAYLDNIVTTTSRRPSITVRSSDSTLFQQPHKLPHSICNHDLSITLHQDIQLRILASLWLFAGGVEAPFGCDRRASRFQNLGDVRTVGDGPTSFLCPTISTVPAKGEGRHLRGKSLISSVA